MAMALFTLITLVTAIGVLNFPETEALDIEKIVSAVIGVIELAADYIAHSIASAINEFFYPPENRNSSIKYLLYTPDNPYNACYLEPTDTALERCPFNPEYPLKFLIHGFSDDFSENSTYGQIKDIMLELYLYNVILVNWTRYSDPPYSLAALNTEKVGKNLAGLIQFLESNANVDPIRIHLIGLSLGAHLAGVAGSEIHNLGRITGLDPAGPLFGNGTWLHCLTYTDAIFVDIIHSSNLEYGFGLGKPNGNMDFYPNGGVEQPRCENGTDNIVADVENRICNHESSLIYFKYSVNDTNCRFISTLCDNYDDFSDGLCPPNTTVTTEMGLHNKMIPGLAPKSKFYLRTSAHEPYCLRDGFEPQ